MSWQMHAIATYGRLIRRPRTYPTLHSARAYLKRRKTDSGPPPQLATSARYQLNRETIDGFGCYTVQSTGSQPTATAGPSVVYVHGGAYVNQIEPAHHEQPGAIHVYPLLPVPEAKPARHTLLDHIGAAFNAPRHNDDRRRLH